MQRILELFLSYFKIGALTFGGGYAMLPMIQDEVIRHGWFSMEELLNFIAVSESTPGSFAVNVATYTGIVASGPIGAIVATLGVVLPSFVIILIIARLSDRIMGTMFFTRIMTGIKPAVTGLILASAVSIGAGIVGSTLKAAEIVILCVAVVMYLFKLHPILIIGAGALMGAILL